MTMVQPSGRPEPVPMTAILVHYRTENQLRQCVDDLLTRADRPAQIIVVDNASLDDPDRWRNRYPAIEWIFNEENLGFAAAANAGARQAENDLLLFLNPDARPDPGSLRALATF